MMNTESNRIIRFNELKRLIGGIDRTTVKRWENEGLFPRRIKLGEKSMGWLLQDVNLWIESKRV